MSTMKSAFGSNPYKFGLFGANCAGGMTLSAAPERWGADWDQIVDVYRMADAAGIEFILPIAKWRGLGGKADMWGRSFETFTHSAAAGAITRHIGVFVTAHVPIIMPAFAAKAITTIDHVTHGRAGLNIVCGWNPDEFDIHGATIDSKRRYEQGLEWFRIYAKMCEGGPPFEWNGEFYKLRGVATDPLPLQRPRPPVMSAGISSAGRDFAAQAADILFTSLPDLAEAPQLIRGVQQAAATQGRSTEVYTQTQIVCRPTRKEAEDFYHYFAEEQADEEALEYFRRQKLGVVEKNSKESAHYARPHANRFTEGSGKRYAGLFPGMHAVVGAPDDVVEELARLKATGIAGSALVFLNYLSEMPLFVQEVLPRMQRVGLRHPMTQRDFAGPIREAS
jgi:alkanesulfonate monooxygenase SsuD/methylene tetrahydromethanopterin reductase-like flavin-dependent oxidoreductase (luciferase family)